MGATRLGTLGKDRGMLPLQAAASWPCHKSCSSYPLPRHCWHANTAIKARFEYIGEWTFSLALLSIAPLFRRAYFTQPWPASRHDSVPFFGIPIRTLPWGTEGPSGTEPLPHRASLLAKPSVSRRNNGRYPGNSFLLGAWSRQAGPTEPRAEREDWRGNHFAPPPAFGPRAFSPSRASLPGDGAVSGVFGRLGIVPWQRVAGVRRSSRSCSL